MQALCRLLRHGHDSANICKPLPNLLGRIGQTAVLVGIPQKRILRQKFKSNYFIWEMTQKDTVKGWESGRKGRRLVKSPLWGSQLPLLSLGHSPIETSRRQQRACPLDFEDQTGAGAGAFIHQLPSLSVEGSPWGC